MFVAEESSITRLAKHFNIVKFMRNLRSMDITDTLACPDAVREVLEKAPEGWANIYQHGLGRDNAWLWRVKDEFGNDWEGTIETCRHPGMGGPSLHLNQARVRAPSRPGES